MKYKTVNNTTYIIGENAMDNWNILDSSPLEYYFFHLSSFPSCYVIAKTEYLNDEVMHNGSMLCLNNTKYKKIPNIYVDICKCKNLKKTSNVGEVQFVKKKNITKYKLNNTK